MASISAARAADGGIAGFAAQPLGLGDGARKRCAQFMRGMRSKTPLCVECGLETGEYIIQGCSDWHDLGRKIIGRHGGQVAAAPGRKAGAKAAQRGEACPDRKHDGEQCDRNDEQQRQAKAQRDLPQHAGAVIERFGDRYPHRALERVIVVNAVVFCLAETGAVIRREDIGFRRV